ncbi:MAG: choice-of-anchor D domain-containing protein, partial [Ignavibacteriota bacterium]
NPGYGAATASGSKGENAGGFFEIIAPFDNTKVIITPNGYTAGNHVGTNTGKNATGSPVPYTIMLRRGECYWVKGQGNDDGNDMTGSIVTSDKPIAILAGHEDAFQGDVGARFLDARDFMIEEMIPAEAWDSTGYVSIPLKEGNGINSEDPGYGENYRVFTNYPQTAKVSLFLPNVPLPYDLWTTKYQYPLPEKDNLGDAVEFRAENGHKFGVMMYDNRGQGSTAPYPAESMMGIIPMSKWKTSFMVYAPGNGFVVIQSYYINIIALRNDIDSNFIKYSFNDSALKPISGIKNNGTYVNIPHHPELKGVRYPVSIGSYYFTNTRDAYMHPDTSSPQAKASDAYLHGAFMVYTYGFRALDPDRDLGDFDGDDFFFSYANPAGASLSSGDSAKFSVTVDSFCGKWHICIEDNRMNDAGIRSITILNDSAGVQFYPAKRSYNTFLDSNYDHVGTGDVQLAGNQKSICFDVNIKNPIDSAYAAVLITDNAGNLKVLDLKYIAPKLSISPSSGNVSFSDVRIGTDTCLTITIVNESVVVQTLQSVKIDTIGGLSLASVSRVLPAQMQPNDSLNFNICYAPNQKGPISDTLHIALDCFTIPIRITGNGRTGLISATDVSFGKSDTAKTVSKSVTITNIGTWGFALITGSTITGSNAFSIIPPNFPTILGPNAVLSITINYSPKHIGKDTAIIHWATDIATPYTQSVKSYSTLTGEGFSSSASVNEQAPALTINIRPNPVKGNTIILTFSSSASEKAEIQIFDLLGKEFYKQNISAGTSQLEIPVGHLQNGIYFARVTIDGKTVSEKFEVMR